MSEFRTKDSQERKEKPRKVVIEIGANEDNSCIKQYQIQLPLDTAYSIVPVNYDILPNEEATGEIIPLEDGSVDEVWISNVLSDLAYFDIPGMDLKVGKGKDRILDFWKSRESLSPLSKQRYNDITSDVAFFQKQRTIKDILRVLKSNGVLRIYENYNQFHPDAVLRILKWLQENPQVEFTEDFVEEQRIQPIFDREHQERINFLKKYEPYRLQSNIYPRRKFNKVYTVVKKPPM